MKKKKYIILGTLGVLLILLYFLFFSRPLYRLGKSDEVEWEKVQCITFRCKPDGKTVEEFSILLRGIFAETPRKWNIVGKIFYEGYYQNGKDHIISKIDYWRLINDFKNAKRITLGNELDYLKAITGLGKPKGVQNSCCYSLVVCFEYSDSRAICIPYHTDEKNFYGADFESNNVVRILKKIDTTKTILEDTTYNLSSSPNKQNNSYITLKIPSIYDEEANSSDANNLIKGNSGISIRDTNIQK
jgi:hypothetical protein